MKSISIYIFHVFTLLYFEQVCFIMAVAVLGDIPKSREDEFKCIHMEDGSIHGDKTCDGWVDCMRDGSDESLVTCGYKAGTSVVI